MGGVGGGERVNDMIGKALKVCMKHSLDQLMS